MQIVNATNSKCCPQFLEINIGFFFVCSGCGKKKKNHLNFKNVTKWEAYIVIRKHLSVSFDLHFNQPDEVVSTWFYINKNGGFIVILQNLKIHVNISGLEAKVGRNILETLYLGHQTLDFPTVDFLSVAQLHSAKSSYMHSANMLVFLS